MTSPTTTGDAVTTPVTTPGTTFAAARRPVAAPAAAPVAIVLALAVLALGVLGVLDGLGALGVVDGAPRVVTDAATALDGTTAQGWMTYVGIVVAVVGLVVLFLALKPRRRLGVELLGETSLWTRPGDVARIASDAASTDPDVLQASSVASRKKVRVTVQTTEQQSSEIAARVRKTVQERLDPLARSVAVSVRTRSEVDQ